MLRSVQKLSELRATNPALLGAVLFLAAFTAATPASTILNGGILIPNANRHGELLNSFLSHIIVRCILSAGSFAAILPSFAEDFVESRQLPKQILTALLKAPRKALEILAGLDINTVRSGLRTLWDNANLRNIGSLTGDAAIVALPFLGLFQSIGYTGVTTGVLERYKIIGKNGTTSENIVHFGLVATRAAFVSETSKKGYKAWESYKKNRQHNPLSQHWKPLLGAFINSIILAIIFYGNSSALDSELWSITIIDATLLFGTIARVKNLDFKETAGQQALPALQAIAVNGYQRFVNEPDNQEPRREVLNIAPIPQEQRREVLNIAPIPQERRREVLDRAWIPRDRKAYYNQFDIEEGLPEEVRPILDPSPLPSPFPSPAQEVDRTGNLRKSPTPIDGFNLQQKHLASYPQILTDQEIEDARSSPTSSNGAIDTTPLLKGATGNISVVREDSIGCSLAISVNIVETTKIDTWEEDEVSIEDEVIITDTPKTSPEIKSTNDNKSHSTSNERK
jgi:hypothetical protein